MMTVTMIWVGGAAAGVEVGVGGGEEAEAHLRLQGRTAAARVSCRGRRGL